MDEVNLDGAGTLEIFEISDADFRLLKALRQSPQPMEDNLFDWLEEAGLVTGSAADPHLTDVGKSWIVGGSISTRNQE